jgi:hypothetical protein
MIVWRLWGVSRDANRAGGTRSIRMGLNDVIRIFVESACLYTSLVLTTFMRTWYVFILNTLQFPDLSFA